MNKEFLFLENLYTLLEAGYSVEDSLNLCEDLLHYPFIEMMKEQLKNGESLITILEKSALPLTFKEYFSFYQNKNCLSEAIEKSLSICKNQKDFQNRLKSQLTYPLVLLLFLFVFSIFVVFVLLPNVNRLFDSFSNPKKFSYSIDLYAFSNYSMDLDYFRYFFDLYDYKFIKWFKEKETPCY